MPFPVDKCKTPGNAGRFAVHPTGGRAAVQSESRPPSTTNIKTIWMLEKGSRRTRAPRLQQQLT
jgi:hypothetical protein